MIKKFPYLLKIIYNNMIGQQKNNNQLKKISDLMKQIYSLNYLLYNLLELDVYNEIKDLFEN